MYEGRGWCVVCPKRERGEGKKKERRGGEKIAVGSQNVLGLSAQEEVEMMDVYTFEYVFAGRERPKGCVY